MILTDTDILRLLNREIVIEPFDSDNLTPVGYDLRVGCFVYSLSRGMLSGNGANEYTIEPGESVLILTKEFVWVSRSIGGTFHSKVSLVSKGFSHISTTLDPNWSGPLLIATCNRSAKCLTLVAGQAFVTLMLHKTISPATKPHGKPPARRDILLQLLTDTTPDMREQFDKDLARLASNVSKVVHDADSQEVFNNRVREASEPGFRRVLQASKRGLKARGGHILYISIHLVLLTAIVLLPIYFDPWLKPVFPQVLSNVVVDTKFFTGVLAATVAILLSLVRQLTSK